MLPQVCDAGRGDRMAAGGSNPQIAGEVCLSPQDDQDLVSSILSNLRATDRAEVIIRARDAGLGRSGPHETRTTPGAWSRPR